jgi:hypothetical protein
MYSISDNTLFGEDRYTKLRANRSEREGKLVASLGVLDRRVRQIQTPFCLFFVWFGCLPDILILVRFRFRFFTTRHIDLQTILLPLIRIL